MGLFLSPGRRPLLAARRLLREKRFLEADGYLAAALSDKPQDAKLAVTYALSAHERGLFQEAIDRWRAAAEAGAPEALCAAGIAGNLRELGDLEGAQRTLDAALARAPDDVNALTEAARLARTRNRPGVAFEHWRRAITLMRPHPDWLQGYAQSLFVLGDLDRASRALASARRRFPSHQGLCAVEGAILVARQDWPRAIAFWTDYRRRFPDDATGWEQLGIAVQSAQLSRSEDVAQSVAPGPAPALAKIEVVEDERMRRLLLRFESIGDSCEMGLVQRRFGAEPLGLLRWNDVRLDNLVTALEHRFEGMGEPDNTEIVVAANGEFFVRDLRWSLGMHTFLYSGHVDASDIYKKMCRRIIYLRGKLIEDLGAAEKIFVYRSPDVDADGLRRLHRALQAFGPVTLLGVQPVSTAVTAFPARPIGEIDQLDESLYVGFLDRPGTDPRGNWDIDFDAWTSIFGKTLAARPMA